MIRDHGDAVEADLAACYHGVDGDLRNLYRPGSGMTMRRLFVLIRGLPFESLVKRELRAEEATATAEAKANKLEQTEERYRTQRQEEVGQ